MWVRLLQLVLGTLTVWLSGRCSLALTERLWVGIVVGFLAAVHAANVLMTSQILAETLFGFLVMLAVTLFLEWTKRATALWAALTGGVLGLALLTRSNLAPVVLFLPFLPVVARGDTALRTGKRYWHLHLMVISAIAVVAPWCVRNSLVHGEVMFITNAGGELLWRGNNENSGRILDDDGSVDRIAEYSRMLAAHGNPSSSGSRDRVAVAEAFRYWRDKPWDAIKLKLRMAGHMLKPWPTFAYANSLDVLGRGSDTRIDLMLPKVGWYLVMDLALVAALFSLRRSATDLRIAFCWTVMGVTLLVGVVFFPELRHRYPFDNLLFVLSGIGLAAIGGKSRTSGAHSLHKQ